MFRSDGDDVKESVTKSESCKGFLYKKIKDSLIDKIEGERVKFGRFMKGLFFFLQKCPSHSSEGRVREHGIEKGNCRFSDFFPDEFSIAAGIKFPTDSLDLMGQRRGVGLP